MRLNVKMPYQKNQIARFRPVGGRILMSYKIIGRLKKFAV